MRRGRIHPLVDAAVPVAAGVTQPERAAADDGRGSQMAVVPSPATLIRVRLGAAGVVAVGLVVVVVRVGDVWGGAGPPFPAVHRRVGGVHGGDGHPAGGGHGGEPVTQPPGRQAGAPAAVRLGLGGLPDGGGVLCGEVEVLDGDPAGTVGEGPGQQLVDGLTHLRVALSSGAGLLQGDVGVVPGGATV